MKMKNKKAKRIVVGFLILAIAVTGWNLYRQSLGNDKSKVIGIKLISDDKTIYKENIRTNAKKLSDLLKELKKSKKIKLTYINSTYGMYITGMGKSKLIMENPNKNLYWQYSSVNNKTCKKAGICPGEDSLKINDGDKFVFKLEKYE